MANFLMKTFHVFFKKMGHCRPLFPLFSSFQYSLQLMFNINFCWWMDSNWGPPETKATTLPNNVFCFRLFGITMSSLFTNRTNDASSSTWDQCYKTFFCHNWLRLPSCWGHSPTGLTQSTKIWGSRTPPPTAPPNKVYLCGWPFKVWPLWPIL